LHSSINIDREISNLSEHSVTPSKPLDAWIRALRNIAPLADDHHTTLPDVIDKLGETFGDKLALTSPTDSLTYSGLAERANQYAHWALAHGIHSGGVVALMMPNCAEYVAIWLGITHVGGVVALINTNLTGDALAHSLTVANARHIIVDSSNERAALAARSRVGREIHCWVHGSTPLFEPCSARLCVQSYPGTKLREVEGPPPTTTDRALLIFTSGTTGLPKAANISHARLLEWSYWFAGLMDTTPDDKMYNCLPMYHSIGGVVAIGALLVNGGAVVIRPAFSARRFWDDIVSNDCTLFQYIGELCRYLVNNPPDPQETHHRLRLCCGNGLRQDVWTAFQQRFQIPRIVEFYASTEGNVSLYNCEGKAGSIGRIPPFLSHRFPVALIKCNDAATPLRNEAGFCIRCAPDEAGEAIGKIPDTKDGGVSQFDGYTDSIASNAKILRDVFTKGDRWFRTGDLMRRDGAGFFYFVDRIGDTFRWKGENVSTSQVAEVVSSCPGVNQAVVYGVAVPHTEGKAGMATIVAQSDFSLVHLREHLTAQLPEYARPLFVRVANSLQITGTFKPTTVQLCEDGYDPNRIDDALYLNDRFQGEFVRLDAARYETIFRGEVRL
jgi:fatty-acyl-CoA synthase